VLGQAGGGRAAKVAERLSQRHLAQPPAR